jgi:branched-chain amino acid transport system permease protein
VFPISLRSFGASLVDDLRHPRGYLTVLAFILATQLPQFIPGEYVHMLILTFIIGMAAVAWNIIGGFGGQFSLGNSMFFGISGYTLGILLVRFEFGFVPAVVVALGLSLVAALIVGYPSFQLTGHYFALATITIVEGLRFLVRYFNEFTGGAQGYSLIPALVRGVTVLDYGRNAYYLAALTLFMFAFIVSVWVRRSKVGYYLMALRDDQLAAASLGINVARFKMIGWLVTALLTGVAGVMYATYIQFLSPGFSFSITQSVLYAVIPIIGGIGTLAGPVIGTFLMVPLEHIAQTQYGGTYGAITYVVYGVLLILLIIYAPEGLRPKLKAIADPIAKVLPTIGSSSSPEEGQSEEKITRDD